MLPGRPQHFCWWGPPCSGKHSAGPSLPHSWKESLCQFRYYLELDIFWDLDVFWVSIGYFRRALPSSLLETDFMLKNFPCGQCKVIFLSLLIIMFCVCILSWQFITPNTFADGAKPKKTPTGCPKICKKKNLWNAAGAMVLRLNHQWLAPIRPGKCFLVVSY